MWLLKDDKVLKIDDSLLVIVDVQGKLAQLMFDKETLFKNCVILAKTAKILNIPIIWCQQNPAALGDTIPELAEQLTDQSPINKLCFSCTNHADFAEQFKSLKRRQAILCGIETHICIHQTAMNLLDVDCDVHVVADAVSSRTESNKKIAIKRMRDEGVSISSTEMALFELLQTAEHPKFKEVAKLIK